MCNCESDKKLFAVFSKYKGQKGALIPVLQEAQDIYGFLPEHCIKTIATALKIPPAKVFGVATFYAQFHLKPRGKHIVRVCLGTACHVRGGSKILEAIENNLGIKNGETTPDLHFTLESVACLGACGLAPVIMVDNDAHGRLTPDKVANILNNYREGREM